MVAVRIGPVQLERCPTRVPCVIPATMNALAPVSFASAYRQLRPAEKAYVDVYVTDIERQAARAGERISLALHRAIPDDVVARSRGMLDIPLVRAAIAERINEIAAASELTVHRVIKEWMAIGFSTFGDYMEIGQDGQPYFDLTKCTPEQLAAIKSIEIEESGGTGLSRATRRKFKAVLHDKLAGLDALSKYMGLLERDNPHWRQDQPRNVTPGTVPAGASVDEVANRYAQMLNG